ncbi:Bromodomain [Dillenia turbinata]|uniref:Bromodomain n=1 Tax=Dillenia turbinata TaxID=194707 RepID=A0AAN8VL22_9MAGN
MGFHDLKHRRIFNSPVEVVRIGLPDYFQIIKHPMDLGTMKSKMRKGLYSSTSDFSADVQFTFDNALLYNPKGHEAYKMEKQLFVEEEEEENEEEKVVVEVLED